MGENHPIEQNRSVADGRDLQEREPTAQGVEGNELHDLDLDLAIDINIETRHQPQWGAQNEIKQCKRK